MDDRVRIVRDDRRVLVAAPGLGGDPGPPGQPRFQGEGAPTDDTAPSAVPGDVYLDVTTGNLYTFE